MVQCLVGRAGSSRGSAALVLSCAVPRVVPRVVPLPQTMGAVNAETNAGIHTMERAPLGPMTFSWGQNPVSESIPDITSVWCRLLSGFRNEHLSEPHRNDCFVVVNDRPNGPLMPWLQAR